jgi:hypothetical protein
MLGRRSAALLSVQHNERRPDARTLGEGGQAIYSRINACTAPDQLDGIMKLLWSEWHPSGVVTDSEAELLTEAVERRRPTSRRALPVGGGVASVGRLASRVQRRFMPRKPQRSPDRKASRERRRMLGGSGCMPSKMGMMFTEGGSSQVRKNDCIFQRLVLSKRGSNERIGLLQNFERFIFRGAQTKRAKINVVGSPSLRCRLRRRGGIGRNNHSFSIVKLGALRFARWTARQTPRLLLLPSADLGVIENISIDSSFLLSVGQRECRDQRAVMRLTI